MACRFALVTRGDAIERVGVAALSELSATIAKVDRVVLLLVASDVTLLRLQVPPLSALRLKAALPNLVEDRLISDPAECVIVAGAASQGERTVAVMQRAWLETIIKSVRAYGARSIAAVPAQLCLPYEAGIVSAAIARQEGEIDLTLRLSEHEGIGLSIMPEQADSSAGEVVQALCAAVPEAPVTLYVPDATLPAYQNAINATPGLNQRITVRHDDWSHWIGGADSTGLDLLAGLGAGFGLRTDWRPWRWPLALAAGVVVINAVGLNVGWRRMQGEADTLRASMIQTYKSAYPKESVILDPTVQMQQKIAAAQRATGQLVADDFMAIAADFGEAWASVMRTATGGKPGVSGIAALEYRERSLFVRLKADDEALAEQMKPALSARGLSLSQPAAGVWRIRSAK